MKICNAFSLQMLQGGIGIIKSEEIECKKLKNLFEEGIIEFGEVESFIGHVDTARVISNILGIKDLATNRNQFILKKGEEIIVAQVMGKRLPEGSMTLPEGTSIRFFNVTCIDEKILKRNEQDAREWFLHQQENHIE